MDHHYDNIDDLIAKKLAGESAKAEDNVLQNWLDASEENRQYYDSLQQVWHTAALSKPEQVREVDTEAALQRVKHRLSAEKPSGQGFNIFAYWRMAAAIVVLIGAVWVFRGSGQDKNTAIIADVAPLRDTLQDGSTVFLNRHSVVSLEEGYAKKNRRIRLTGEAYFEVKHQDKQDFTVLVKDLEIRDIGTKFNVDNASNPDKVVVSVTEGAVELSTKGQKMRVEAKQTAIYDLKSGALVLEQKVDANVLAYQSRYFDFDSTPLHAVIARLNRAYGVNIELGNPALADCLLTARYDNETLDRVLELISDSFPVKVKQENGQIRLEGQGCN